MRALLHFAETYLLVTSGSSQLWRRGGLSLNHRPKKQQSASAGSTAGKKQFSSSGVGNRNKHRQKRHRENKSPQKSSGTFKHFAVPPVTSPGGPFPSYFTCRHTYEDALVEEISRSCSNAIQGISIFSPCPGLVRVETTGDITAAESCLDDPIYALQTLPDCVVVTAPSIKQLAVKALQTLLDNDNDSEISRQLRAAPRGSLAVHALVPGMLKGQRDPVLQRRAQKVAEEACVALKKGYKCARKAPPPDNKEESLTVVPQEEEKWVLQLLLLSPEVLAASLALCARPLSRSTWPSCLPAGLAQVDISEDMPSSAYRKLLEALNCLQSAPSPEGPPVIDLGACPGGWTAALRRLDCKVIAVDRSPLQEDLMADERVEFVKGDAFSYRPPWAQQEDLGNRNAAAATHRSIAPDNTWMVSDVIAYPEKIAELLEQWCGCHWAGQMIVTVKFQGQAIPWEALEAAITVATSHGYKCRAKHFFNNKNEVTLMIVEDTVQERVDSEVFVGKSMYPAALPMR